MSPVSVLCQCPCHQHHTLQLEWYLLCQTCLAGLWWFCQFSSGPYCLLVVLQRVVWCTCSCQTDMQIWWEMRIFYHFGLCYIELASIMVMYCTFVSLGSISFNVGPLCISCTSAWLSLAGSWHSHKVSLGVGTITYPLHQSAVSSSPSGTNIYCSCSLSSSFFEWFL